MELKIRPLSVNDIDRIMEWVNDPLILSKFANFSPVTKMEELAFLEKLIVSRNDFTYTIETDEGEYIGQASINKVYWAAKNGRFAITIHPKMRGKGFVREIILKMIHEAFELIGLHKIWVMLKEDNEKAHKMFLSLGFLKEAVLIDEYIDPISKEYLNMIRFYKIKDGQ